jgi:hypothetical protein
MAWSLEKAKFALAELRVAGPNREVAEYWLSLWSDDKPPMWENFALGSVKEHALSIAMFEVMPDGPVICRLAGEFVKVALGFDPAGEDLLAITPEQQRETRIKQTRAIVDGAISYAHRSFRFQGHETIAAEIALPFAGLTEGGGRRYLLHSEWSPTQVSRVGQGQYITDAGLAVEQRILSICS